MYSNKTDVEILLPIDVVERIKVITGMDIQSVQIQTVEVKDSTQATSRLEIIKPC